MGMWCQILVDIYVMEFLNEDSLRGKFILIQKTNINKYKTTYHYTFDNLYT